MIDKHIEEHFEDILEMVEIDSGAQREIGDVCLSRHACHSAIKKPGKDK